MDAAGVLSGGGRGPLPTLAFSSHRMLIQSFRRKVTTIQMSTAVAKGVLERLKKNSDSNDNTFCQNGEISNIASGGYAQIVSMIINPNRNAMNT